jgi:hypothetical protein
VKNKLVEWSRASVIARRRSVKLRRLVPHRAIYYLAKCRSYWSGVRSIYMPVRERTSADNIFHCCVQKTGSMWIKSLLTDLMTYRYAGLSHYHYQSRMMKGRDPRKLTERTFSKPFPKGTIISPLYSTFENFSNIPKAGSYRAFFVVRDPRDIVVSWYFSAKKLHILQGDLVTIRPILEQSSLEDGLIYSIRHLSEYGMFEAVSSWVGASEVDPNVQVVRFEDLIGPDAPAVFKALFEHLDIRMDDESFAELLHAYSFERVTRRKKGEESKDSPLRKGQAGDWKNHFDEQVLEVFNETTGDLVERLGYEVAAFEPVEA